MKESRKPATPKTWGGSAHEFGAVTIDFKPGPDSRNRLRRLYCLLLEHAPQERSDSEEDHRECAPTNDGSGEE